MLSGYSYVEGADLARFVLEVRDEFVSRLPFGSDDTRRPNSVRLVAIDLLVSKTTDEQLAILRDLIDANHGLVLTREDDRDVFEYSDTPGAYVADLVCEVVCQILDRDPSIRDEDDRRLALAIDCVEEQLDEQ
jgi:hypothetical protein